MTKQPPADVRMAADVYDALFAMIIPRYRFKDRNLTNEHFLVLHQGETVAVIHRNTR
jgi:hypothetical protein